MWRQRRGLTLKSALSPRAQRWPSSLAIRLRSKRASPARFRRGSSSVPDPERPTQQNLPVTPTTIAYYADIPPAVGIDDRLAIDLGHAHIAWRSRCAGKGASFRILSLVTGESNEIAVPDECNGPLRQHGSDELPDGPPAPLRFRPGTKTLLAVDPKGLMEVDMTSGQIVHHANVWSIFAVSPSGAWAAVRGARRTVLIELDTGRVLDEFPDLDPPIAFSPDGRTIFGVAKDPPGPPQRVYQCDVGPPPRCRVFASSESMPGAMAVSNTAVFLVDHSMGVRVLDRATGKDAARIEVGETWAAAIFPDEGVEIGATAFPPQRPYGAARPTGG